MAVEAGAFSLEMRVAVSVFEIVSVDKFSLCVLIHKESLCSSCRDFNWLMMMVIL
jgi:hypothetical protein